MATLQIADKPTLDIVNTDVIYVKNNIPTDSSSPVIVIKNKDSEFTGVDFTVSGGDFTDTVTMPDDDSISVEVPYVGTYAIEWEDGSNTVDVTDIGDTIVVPKIVIDVVPFSTGTDEQIKTMLDAYYANKLTWSEMGWAIGDTRTISLAQMSCPNPNSSSSLSATNITVVIVDHDHTDLATPINGHTKACITVNFRECIGSLGSWNGRDGSIYINGDSSKDTTFTKWSNLYMRTYLNSTVLGAMSSTFKAGIKPSTHYRHTTYSGNTSEQVTDNLFLPSYPEIYGTASFDYYVATNPTEGTQFAYYQTTSNRIKYGNNNGSPNSTAAYWWMGSASSGWNSSSGYYWCRVNTDRSADRDSGVIALGLAPAFVM